MINLFITVFGGILVIVGIYAMSFGFAKPPNILFFFIGLCLFVLGVMIMIIFGDRVKSRSSKIPASEMKMPIQNKNTSNAAKIINPKTMPKNTKRPGSSIKMKKPVAKKPQESADLKRAIVSEKLGSIARKERKPAISMKINPKRVPNKDVKEPIAAKGILKESREQPKIMPQKEEKLTGINEILTKTPKKEKPKVMNKKATPVKPIRKTEKQFVKHRLNRLKENYIKNTEDIENLIEERLDSFKGTLYQVKSESKDKSESRDPIIIWSFDTGELQETMNSTILKGNKRILMMYPWIRNINVNVLKRFMETESKMIIQEASLDDDTSVELINLLMDNNVKIKTLPHIHTVAVVSDEENGLIISTDPIYNSFEVGVIYKDQKSIIEIERLFKEAWDLSQDIELK